MAESDNDRAEELRSLLTDAIEVQLAALKAGIGFWSEWIEEASDFVQSATDSLSNINSGSKKTEDALLELLDKGRASARSLTEIPRHTATRFIEELDAAEAKRSGAKKSSAKKAAKKAPVKKAASTGSTKGKTRRKRAVRAKE